MKFSDYLDMRIQKGGTPALAAEWLKSQPGMPDDPRCWTDVKICLMDTQAGRAGISVGKTVWYSYTGYLRYAGYRSPAQPNAVCAHPDAAGAVVDAPPLTRLCELGHETRKIGWQASAATWKWCGDLEDLIERRKYLTMLHEHGSVTQFSRFPPTRMPILFAHIAAGVDPAGAYGPVSATVEASIKRRPRWLTMKAPHVDLGQIL